MKIFGVGGRPILHSLSPQIHAALFERSSIDAAYCRVRAESAEELVSMIRGVGFEGLNVTAPFKETILPLLDEVDTSASAVGSVNTILNDRNRLTGLNTDPRGMIGPLVRRGIKLSGKRCLVLGAGGAARAAVWALIQENAAVTVINRTPERAVRCASDFGCRAERMAVLTETLKRSDILVNTIPEAADILQPSCLPRGVIVVDSIYRRPWLSSIAAEKGAVYISGVEWLRDQALESFYVFTKASREGGPGRTAGPIAGFPKGKTANVALIGAMGSGKTTVGRILASRLGFEFTDADERIEKTEGRSVADIFARDGEACFREKERAVIRELATRTGVVLACGGGAVLDPENRALLKKHALVVWLFAPTALTLERMEEDTRPLLRVPDPKRRAEELFEARKSLYALTSDIVINSVRSSEEVAGVIHEEIDHAVAS